MPTFPSSLVTPENVVFEGEVEAVMLRTDVGEATFLAGHTPLIGSMVPGLVRFQDEDGTIRRVAVHGGFVHVKHDGVTVLAPVAELAADIDIERARRALEAAELMVTEASAKTGSGGDDDLSASGELAEAQAAVLRAQVRIEVAGT